MGENSKLFDDPPPPPKPRATPRKLMHVIDGGEGDLPGHDWVLLKCKHCNHVADWQQVKRAEHNRGVPCPKCN